MKRILILLLCFLILLTGCKKEPEPNLTLPWEEIPENTIQVTESSEPEVTEPEIVNELWSVSVPAVSEQVFHENGTELFTFTAQHMQLIIPNAVVAEKVVLNFLNRVDTARTEAGSIMSAASVNYTDDDTWLPYYVQLLFSPTRIDHGVLSMFGMQNTYSGGNHGNRSCTAVNYDLMTGDILTLGSIMHAEASKEDFIRIMNEKLEQIADERNLYEDYQSGVEYRLGGDENLYEDFFFTPTGLTFFFSPYEIAPYSSGYITVEIPYNELTGLIYDGYFPEEREQIQGDMLTALFNIANAGQFNNMAELNLSVGESVYAAYPEGQVEDIRIHISGDNMNLPDYTVFAAFEMSGKDAVIISLMEDMVDRVTISYTSANVSSTIPLRK